MSLPTILQVRTQVGSFGCTLPRHGFSAIKMNGEAVTELSPGWKAVQIYTAFNSVLLLELHHTGGLQTLWYLDASLNYLANTIEGLEEDVRTDLLKQVRTISHVVARSILCQPTVMLDDRVHGFLALGDQTRYDLVTSALSQSAGKPDAFGPPSTLVSVHELTDEGIFKACGDNRVPLSIGALRFILAQSMLGLAPAAIGKGALRLPSPFSGRPTVCDAALPLAGITVAYRFVDEVADSVFFVIATELFVRTIAVYLPAMGICFTTDKSTAIFLEHHRPGLPIEEPLIRHILTYAGMLVPYLQRKDKRFVTVFEHHHLGHHLWQELTGTLELVRHVAVERLPELYVINAEATEMFGRYDDLFPEYIGKVNRSCTSWDQFVRATYNHGLVPLCPTGCYVQKELGHRIVALAERSPGVANDRALLRGARQLKLPIVLIGLRVENRTIVDLRKFCVEVIEFIATQADGLLVIIDGHNIAPSVGQPLFFTSHFEALAAKPPVEVETEIVAQLRREFGSGKVLVHDTIGASMAKSIFWSNNCDFFVAPWGAGLAKYRWVANKPGLILAGEEYLRHGLDMHIYIADNTLEAPTPVHVLDIQYVKDVPNGSSLIPLPEASRRNYHVDFRGVAAELSKLLADYAGQAGNQNATVHQV
jgi:hypothetical protein